MDRADEGAEYFVSEPNQINGPDSGEQGPIELPIDGVLDLHTFRPQEIKELVPDYLRACHERGILRVRIIHGKGIGNLRRTVHALLLRHPQVASYALASEAFGGWGATIVHLKPDGDMVGP
jgi:DNA-nicking Smr family endonuclease